MQNTEDRIQETEGVGPIILKPPKIYLDTKHLIYIVHVRKGETLRHGQSADDYRRLDDYLKSYCGVIFNPEATMDWVGGGATEVSAGEIAAVIDSANLKYTMPQSDSIVDTQEILNQCRNQNPNIRLPNLHPILQKISDNTTYVCALNILVNQVPGYLDHLHPNRQVKLPEVMPVCTVREWVEDILARRQKNPEDFQNRIDRFKAGLSYDIEHQDEFFRNPEHRRNDWLDRHVRYLKIEMILKTFNPDIDVDSVLKRIDMTKCPAISLYWKVREKRMKAGKLNKAGIRMEIRNTDLDDYKYLAVVPYADILLIENQLHEFIRQADRSLQSKVFCDVGPALKALEDWGSTR